jgi:hypothetical protein
MFLKSGTIEYGIFDKSKAKKYIYKTALLEILVGHLK